MLQINKNVSLLAPTSILLFFSMAFTTINARIGVLPLPQPVVVDIDGDPVQVGVEYHLVSYIWGAGGGGLALGPNRNRTKICPLSVVQLPLDTLYGLPIRFFPVNHAPVGSRAVRTSTDYLLQFNSTGSDSSICGKEPIWKLDAFDESVGKYFISTTNVITTDMAYQFKIESVGGIPIGNYKLSYCPNVCSTCERVLCKDIGVDWDPTDVVRRLALTDDYPFVLVFLKASSVEQINAL
ncbi:hypothetical protein Sjap_025608 [Stephania japonica]|uniref:Uncharacterized protein n=1 Tax=Stephania japonica TaxID=461633 RepID=A0AAP0HHP6_9MAGN